MSGAVTDVSRAGRQQPGRRRTANRAAPPHVQAARKFTGLRALNGTVPSYPQYLEAAAAARRVAGVWNLQNHLEVVLPNRPD